MRFFKLPPQLEADIKILEGQVADFKAGTLPAMKFKGLRVAHGLYEQRELGTHMVRLRCPGGAFTPVQLHKAGVVSEKYGAKTFAISTRGGIQLSYVDLDDLIKVVRELAEVGLSGRAGGGNTVRNIVAPFDAGVDPDEVFDVSPYVFSLTTRMVEELDSLDLPRKFKMAFSGQGQDPTKPKLTCLGFWAKIKDGEEGFQVWVGGGTASSVKPGHLLIDWIPGHRVYYVAKAMKRMFDQHGNRRQKGKAKLKWLYAKLGKDEFERLFFKYYAMEQQVLGLELKLAPVENRADIVAGYSAEQPADAEAYAVWKQRNVTKQKQEGLFQTRLPLLHGNLSWVDAKALADLAMNFGENCLRAGTNQNLYLRNIPEAYLANIFNAVKDFESLELSNEPELFGAMVTCTGAETCALGMTLSRPAVKEIQRALLASDLNLDALGDLKIQTSGCPNSCASNHTADIGLFGKTGKVGQDVYPAYMVQIGSFINADELQLASRIASISAKDLPNFMVDYIQGWQNKKVLWPSVKEYLRSDEAVEDLLNMATQYNETVPSALVNEDYYFDWSDDKRFSLLKGRKAECSAGLFDMIDVDFENVTEATKLLEAGLKGDSRKKELYRLIASAAHSLLVTRGVEAFSDEEVFDCFVEQFVNSGLVPKLYLETIQAAKAQDLKMLDKRAGEVIMLGEHMKKLYESMDDSLRFNVEQLDGADQAQLEPETKAESTQNKYNGFKDFRGVACPMNFVKTKIALAPMSSGETLEVYLDDGEPIINVPESVRLEGHEILTQDQADGGYWSVVIKKA